MALARLMAAVRAAFSIFGRARHASAAVEFALIAPLSLLLYVGVSEIGDGVIASRRMTMVTRTLVDLVAVQGTTTQATSTPTPGNATSATTLSSLLTAAASLMAPEPITPLTMTITALDVTNTSQGTCCSALVRWSYTQGGTIRPCAVQFTALPSTSDYAPTQIPAGLLPYGTTLPSPISVLIADVTYTYQPLFAASVFKFAPVMSQTQYTLPRSTGQVATGALPSSGAQYGNVCY